MDRHQRQNEKLPVVSFRCDAEFKNKIVEYAKRMGYINDLGEGIASSVVFEIVDNHFKTNGILKTKKEWMI